MSIIQGISLSAFRRVSLWRFEKCFEWEFESMVKIKGVMI